MSEPAKRHLLLVLLLLVGAAVFFTGITWGLPSRHADPYLFGRRTPWSGQQIMRLLPLPGPDPTRAADVDVNATQNRDRPMALNATDQQRAEIVRRYRLFTYQPDEMITMMSLAAMNPSQGDLDPKLYQYGGLWIYPVGAMLKISSVLGLIHLTPDLAYYLDHPEAFGRFYIVARAYAALWGLIGAWAVFHLTRQITGKLLVCTAATLCYLFMPIVVNMSHEAKPHLPGAVLILLSTIAVAKYLQSGLRRWWITTGILCGAAFGMVLSGWVALAIIPVMALLDRQSPAHRAKVIVAATLIALAVYFVTNPYVLIDLFNNRAVLQSNLRNSGAMYSLGDPLQGLINAAMLVVAGMSALLGVAAAAGAAALALPQSRGKQAESSAAGRNDAVCLLGAPASLVCLQFVALAAGKPAEYARFALFLDIALVIAGVAAVERFFKHKLVKEVALVALVATTVFFGTIYLQAFLRDCRMPTSRIEQAKRLRALNDAGASTLAVTADPAPYCLPPVDLFSWQIVRLPEQATTPQPLPDVIVFPVDRPTPWPPPLDAAYSWLPNLRGRESFSPAITWADKPFEIRVKRHTARTYLVWSEFPRLNIGWLGL